MGLMVWLDAPPLDSVFRRREHAGDSLNERRLHHRIAAGSTVRVAPGCFADAGRWTALTPMQRHAQRVWEAASRVSPGTVFSHLAAAAVHGIDQLGEWPVDVDISVSSASGGRSTGLIRRHTRDLRRIGVSPWGSHFVTTPLQTVIDLAATSPFLTGVVAADQLLWARRKGGPYAEPADLLAAAVVRPGRGSAKVGHVAEFARAGADSVRESQSRVLMWRLGFPEPQLQRRFDLLSGRVAYTDFYFPEQDHVGEFDGVGKYVDPALLRGRSPQQALIEEKDREDEVRRCVRGMSRWRTPALDDPRRLWTILIGAGLPTRSVRPGR